MFNGDQVVLSLALGPIELAIIFLIFGVVVGGWIYSDAKSRGSRWAWQWAVGIVILFLVGMIPGILALIIYLSKRSPKNNKEKSNKVS